MATEDVGGQPGVGVDAHGGGVVDPTKNVLDLVRAESKYQDAMRDGLKDQVHEMVTAIKEQFKILSDSIVLFQNAQRQAETGRIDQLAETRQEFQNTIRDMLAESVRTTSTLVSTQLVQIQSTFDNRVSKLEAYQFTQAGKSSIADPQMSDYMAKFARDLSELRTAQELAIGKMSNAITLIQTAEGAVGGRQMGRTDTNARMLAVVMAIAAVASPVVSILVTIMVMRGHP